MGKSLFKVYLQDAPRPVPRFEITRAQFQEVLEKCLEEAVVCGNRFSQIDEDRTRLFKEEIRRFGSVAEQVAFGTWTARTQDTVCHCPVASVSYVAASLSEYDVHDGIPSARVQKFVGSYDSAMRNLVRYPIGIAAIID